MKLNSQSMKMIKILQENLKTYVPPLMDLTTGSIKKQIKKIISLIQSSLANIKKQHACVIWSWDDTKTTKNMLVHPKQRFTYASLIPIVSILDPCNGSNINHSKKLIFKVQMFPNLKFQMLKNQINTLESLVKPDLPFDDSTSFLSTQTMDNLGGWRLRLSLLFGWCK